MTDNDRSLLEDAAKAYGLEVTGYDPLLGLQYVNGSDDSPFTDYFNSLTDNGDALRLQVVLFLSVKIFKPEHDEMHTPGMVEVWREEDEDPLVMEYFEVDVDLESVVRRAITRAAAQIWRNRK